MSDNCERSQLPNGNAERLQKAECRMRKWTGENVEQERERERDEAEE
jgi:hypothetical protein